MDGNGRWAKEKGKPRIFGHQHGAEALKKTVFAAHDLGVKFLTVYAFSTENWSRPQDEVSAIIKLLKVYTAKALKEFKKKNVRLRFIGRRDSLSDDLQSLIGHAEESTKGNDAFTLTVAFNYGAREEIVRAHNRIVQEGVKIQDEDAFSRYLDTKDLPDPDILIRTSGEKRISNFLLWQLSYAELFFIDTYWPDFSKSELKGIIEEYMGRERRFGLTSSQIKI